MFQWNVPNIHISILAELIIFRDPFDTWWVVIKDPFVLSQREEKKE